MLRFYGCLTGQHDLRLVALAAVICLFTCFTTTSLLLRARADAGRRKLVWLSAAALVFGCGVWSTHFVGELAYTPGLPVGYDLALTMLSLVLAVTVAWLGLLVAMEFAAPISGGALVGAALCMMHYVGVEAMLVSADFHSDFRYVLASATIGAGLSMAALRLLSSERVRRSRAVGASLLLVLAVCGLHFAGMTAITLVPDPEIPMPKHVVAPALLALSIAAVMTVTIALALFGSFVDGHLKLGAALRAASAADRAKSDLLVQMGQEIKQRSLMEAALRKSEGRLKAIAENLVEGVLLVDRHGHILFANRSAHRLLACRPNDLTGHDLDDVVEFMRDGEPVDFEHGPISQTIETGSAFADDNAAVMIGNRDRLDVGFAVTRLDDEGNQSTAVVSFRSIASLKAAQREALQSSRLASVGQLAAGIAHEINTPIQYVGDNLRFIQKSLGVMGQVVGSLEALLADTANAATAQQLVADQDIAYLLEELPQAASQSLEGVDHVAHIVRSMKEFSHPGTTAKVAVDINRAIDSTVTVSRNTWQHVAKLTTDLDRTLPPVTCFPAELNQVLLNLVVNAAHALETRRSAEPGEIRVTSRRDGDFVEIRVADNGPGVPKSIRDRIFDPFFTTKGVGKGTGQGLSICLDVIVSKHGGQLFLDEGIAGGAVFVMRLPIGAVAAPSSAARASDVAA